MSRMRVFFCQQYETTFRQLCNGRFSPNSASTRESSVKRRIRTEIYEKFPFRGHLAPKPQTSKGSNRYLTQSRLEVKGYTVERYCLLHVVVHARATGPESLRYRSTLLYDVRGCGATGHQSCPIFEFWPIFPIQNPENVPSGDQPTAQGLHRRMIPIFPCGSRRSNGVPSGT